MKKIIQLVGGTLILSMGNSTYASDAIGPGDSDSRWILGGTLAASNNVYVGEDDQGYLFPNITYNGDVFFVKNGTLNLSFGQLNQFSGGLTVRGDGSYLSDVDNYEDNLSLRGIDEREYTIEGGFYVNHTTDLGRFNLTAVSDLDGEHNGETVFASYTFDFKIGDWYVNPVVGLEWISDEKVNHLYGVSASEALATRAAYEGDSALNAFIGIRGRYEFTDHWDVNVKAGATYLDSEISDSSIVDEDYIYGAAVSVNYNF